MKEGTSVFTTKKLLQAYLNCRRNKRKTINALQLEIEQEIRLLQLLKKLQEKKYSPCKSICFVVTYPKVREIFAADFADRVVHHLLINEIEPLFEKRFISDSFACRKGKGTHKAVERLSSFVNKITINRKRSAYYLQLDIKSFFPKIDKIVLYSILKRNVDKSSNKKLWKSEILWLSRKIIFHDPTTNCCLKSPLALIRQIPAEKSLFKSGISKGLPIGNLTSQFFANVYLNELDQFIKRQLKVKYYLRYVDDLIILSDNVCQLLFLREKIDSFLKEYLKLELHFQKDKLGSVYQGIDFLGYIVFPSYSLVRNRVVGNLKTKLYFANRSLRIPNTESIKKVTAIINSYYGHFRKAKSYNLRKNICQKHLGKYKDYLEPEKDLRFFRPRKPSR